jgi:GT2 family glycosyltransferase
MINNKISVIIPCRNEVNYIENLLYSISESDYPINLIEVIVVDGMSDDGTRDLLFSIVNTIKVNIKVIDNKQKKTPYAFNIGIKASSGEFILIAGARFILSKNYLSEAIKAIVLDQKIGCVGGKIINSFDNKTSEIISAAMSSSFGVGFNNFRTVNEDKYVDTVTPPFFRKTIFSEIGYFDEQLTRNQDDDFSYRLIQSGYKILLKSNIHIKYHVRGSFYNLYVQYKQYGYWKVFVNRKHKVVTTIRQLFPVLFVISIILLTLLSFIFPILIYLLFFELASYIILNFLFASKDNGFNLINGFKQMYACFILHLSYGLGYLEGIYDFIFLNNIPNEKNEKLSR